MWERGPDDGAHGTLRGHVARANPVWRDAAGSRCWPSSRARRPTSRRRGTRARPPRARWCRPGTTPSCTCTACCASLDDAAWLRALVGRLTDTPRSRARRAAGRWATRRPTTSQQMLRAIVGIEIQVTRAAGQVEGQPEPQRQPTGRAWPTGWAWPATARAGGAGAQQRCAAQRAAPWPHAPVRDARPVAARPRRPAASATSRRRP